MHYAFAVGPITTAEQGGHLVALSDGTTILGAEVGTDPVETLRHLRAGLRGSLTVDGSLADFAEHDEDVAIGELPEAVVCMRVSLALSLVNEGATIDVPPSLFVELTAAMGEFASAAPWRWIDSDTPIGVRFKRGGPREASVLGEAGEVIGIAAYTKRGVVARVAASSESDAMLREDFVAVTLSDEPRWAAEAVKALIGHALVPMVMGMHRGRPRLLDALALHHLTALATAVAQLEPDEPRVKLVGETPAGKRDEISVTLKPSDARFDADSSRSHEVELETPIASRERENRGKIGRNAPCPCGSGKKYKRCCMGGERVVTAVDPVSSRRSRAAATLAVGILEWIEATDPHAAARTRGIQNSLRGLQSRALAVPLLVHHLDLGGGETAIDRWKRQHQASLSRSQRDALAEIEHGRVSIWEVVALTRGEGFEAADLLTGAIVKIRDVAASRSIAPRAAMLLRVVHTGGPIHCIDGLHDRFLPPERADAVVERLRDELRLEDGPADPERIASWTAIEAMVRLWDAEVEGQTVSTRPQNLQNTDGQIVEQTRDRFSIVDLAFDDVLDRLAEDFQFRVDEENAEKQTARLTWLGLGNAMHPQWLWTCLGTVEIRESSLVAEANSQVRADALQGVLQHHLEPHLKHISRDVEPPRTVNLPETAGAVMVDAQPVGVVANGPGMPAYLFRDQMRGFATTRSRELADLTPVEAVEREDARRKLHGILRSMEFNAPDGCGDEVLRLRTILGLDALGQRVPIDPQQGRMGFGAGGSETLLDFARPVLSDAFDDHEADAIIAVAALVWNARSGSPDVRATALAMLTVNPVRVDQARAEHYVDFLIRRRQMLDFARDERFFRVLDSKPGRLRVETSVSREHAVKA